MADNEDESDVSSTTTGADHGTIYQVQCVSGLPENETSTELENQNQVGEKCIEEQGLTDFLQSCTKEETFVAKDSQVVVSQTDGSEQQPEQNITSIVETSGIENGAEYSTVSADFVNALAPGTTIIYVQPDGSFVEGSGLTAEEQQQLVEQLAKQQLVTVTESEAARLFEQNQVIKTLPTTSSQTQYTIPSTALAPNELQQVLEQVIKSQQSMAQTPKESEQVVTTLDPTTGLFTTVAASEITVGSSHPLVTMQNASQQLKKVAKQVALQSHNGTRLVPKKETIRIQVQMPSGKQEVKGPTQATISIPQQKNLALTSQGQQVKVSTNGSVNSSPQIIHITPMVGQQQYFLQQNPGDPPIQLLLQSSTPVVGSLVPIVHKLPIPVQTPVQQPSGKAPVNDTAVKPATAAATTSVSVPASTVEKVKRVKARVKKAPNIKTRSGRVSRPPKYKVKDYKFIKTEDLAEGHQSDSDDYSEISVEEDEDGEDSKKGAASMSYSHKRKAFQCETCDKAYIGHGGLSRHYRLNPSHGELKSPPEGTPKTDSPGKRAGAGAEHKKSAEESNACSVKNTSGPEKSDATEKTAAATSTTQQKVDTTAAQGVAASTRQAVSQVVVQARGPGRPRGRGRPPTKGLPTVAAHPAVRRGRRGRPPKLGGGVASVEQQAQRRKARLKEVTHECDNEELMETVLPRLAKVMTVWEFLLMKVEKGRQPKAQFLDVYREFEQLHSQVKKMAQDYISNPQQGVHTALEVHNVDVAKSLGIVDEVNRLKVLNPPTQQNVTNMATKNVRYMENSKMLPPTKRFKMENRAGVQIHQNGIETSKIESSEAKVENTASTSMKDISPQTQAPTKSPAGPLATQTAIVKPQDVSSNPETNVTPMELIQDHLSNSMTETVDSAGGEAMETCQGVSGTEPTDVLSTSDMGPQATQTAIFKPQVVSSNPETNITPMELIQDHLSNSMTETVDSAGGEAMETCQGASGTEPTEVLSTSDMGPQATQTAIVKPHVVSSNPEMNITPMELIQDHLSNSMTETVDSAGGETMETCQGASGMEPTEVLSTTDIADQMKELEKALATDPVPVDQQPRSSSTQLHQPNRTLVQQSDLTLAVSSGGQVGVQETQGSQEGQEIYIQTEGLTMHLAEGQEGDMASERIVIVNGPDGTTMHIRAPEGVPLEAVHALLGIEAEGKTQQ